MDQYKIQSQTISVTIPKGQTQAGVQVTFRYPFDANPVIVCSLDDNGPSSTTGFVSCMTWNRNQNGFMAFVKFNRGVDPLTSDLTVNFNWIAMFPAFPPN